MVIYVTHPDGLVPPEWDKSGERRVMMSKEDMRRWFLMPSAVAVEAPVVDPQPPERNDNMEELLAALNSIIDARLVELGLVEAAEPEPETPPPKPGSKAAKAAAAKNKKAPEHTVDELKEKLVALVAAQNKQAAVDALSRFGCKKLADIKPEQIDEFYTYLESLEDGTDPAAGSDLFD